MALVVPVASKSNHIAIFGGSFDPPHLGHFELVRAALQHLNIDEIWLIPVGSPAHRKLSGKATSTQRMAWLSQMFKHEKQVKIVTWEVNNPNITPAIATLQRFQAENPYITPTWLMGMDSFLDLPNWVGYPAHQSLCNLVVFQRQGHKKTIDNIGWKEHDLKSWQQTPPQQAGHIAFVDADLPEVSSTLIRQSVRTNMHQLPKSTCNAILACYASDLEDGSLNQEREDT